MGNTLKAALMGIGFMVVGAAGATAVSATAAPGGGPEIVDDAGAERSGERDGRRGRRGHRGKGMMRAIDSLDLSAEQEAEIDAIKNSMREGRGERGERGERDGGRSSLLTAETIDRAAAHASLSERQVREHDRLDAMIDVVEVLTPEQRSELAAKAEAHREQRGERGERGGRRGHGRR